MVGILKEQRTRKVDLVTPAASAPVKAAQVVLSGLNVLVEADGVTDPNSTDTLTEAFDEGIANRLEFPRAYPRRPRERRPDLYNASLNGLRRGGQLTAGGVMRAITSDSQTVPDADTAVDMEIKALQAMEQAAVRR